MNKKLDIIAIGESLIELSSEKSLSDVEQLDKYFGGDALTSIVCAAKMGSNVGFITSLGEDYFKKFLLEEWALQNIDISNVKFKQGYNGLYFVARVDECEKEFSYYRKKTAASFLSIDDINEDYITSARVFYATGSAQTLSLSTREAVKKAFKLAHDNGVICAYDPNFNNKLTDENVLKEVFDDVYENIDIIFLNLKKDVKSLFELDSSEIMIKQLFDKGIKTVIIKSVNEGKYYLGTNSEIKTLDFYTKKTIDTTGAGDAFNGAFLHAYIKGFTQFEALKFANIVAGLQSQNVGAIKSIPSKEKAYSIFEGKND